MIVDFTDPANTGGSWLKRHVVRCQECRRRYTSLALTTARCPRCWAAGPWEDAAVRRMRARYEAWARAFREALDPDT